MNECYTVELEKAGGLDTYQLATCRSAKAAGEMVRILLAVKDDNITAIRIVKRPVLPQT